MKQTLIVPFDLYSIYERTLEGVVVNVTIEYDLEHMIQHTAINDSNIKIINMEFAKDGLPFLESKSFSKKKILREVKNEFEDFDTLQEEWGKQLPDDEYERIKYIVENNLTHPPKGVVGKAYSITEILDNAIIGQ